MHNRFAVNKNSKNSNYNKVKKKGKIKITNFVWYYFLKWTLLEITYTLISFYVCMGIKFIFFLQHQEAGCTLKENIRIEG